MTEDDDVWIYSLGESIEKRSIRKLKMIYKDHVIHEMEDYGDDDECSCIRGEMVSMELSATAMTLIGLNQNLC